MSFVFLTPKGAVVLAALALLIPQAIMAQSELAVAQADTTTEGARFVVFQGDTLWVAETMEVLGSRVPAALPGMVRTVNVLTVEDVERAPARSVAELLQTVPGVVVSQRQQYGVQSDLSIRGSTFDQVQMLLNGFDVSDPQTGHHLMNLPVGLHDIGRLEVLPGQGKYWSPAFITEEGETTYKGEHSTDVITRNAIDWLENKRDKDKPFMAMVHYKAPHRNWQPTKRWKEKFKGKTFPEPDTETLFPSMDSPR